MADAALNLIWSSSTPVVDDATKPRTLQADCVMLLKLIAAACAQRQALKLGLSLRRRLLHHSDAANKEI